MCRISRRGSQMTSVTPAACLLTVMVACGGCGARHTSSTNGSPVVKATGTAPPANTKPSPPVEAQQRQYPPNRNVTLATWTKAELEPNLGVAAMAAHLPSTGARLSGMALLSQQVRAFVAGGLARTEIDWQFRNETNYEVEGCLTFALPEGASVSRLDSWFGNKLVEGRVVEMGLLNSLSRSKVNSGQWSNEPRLVASHGGEMFSTIARPIPANGRVKIRIAYDEPLQQRAGYDIYRFPFQSGTSKPVSLRDFGIQVVLLDLDENSEIQPPPNFAAKVLRQPNRATISFQSQGFTPEEDFIVKTKSKTDATADSPSKGIGYFALRLVTDPPESHLAAAFRVARRVIILDKSYVQSNASLRYQQRIVEAILKQAPPGEQNLVMACDRLCEVWPSDPTGASIQALSHPARDWFEQLKPSGTFDLEGAVAQAVGAFNSRPSQVVVMTAGRISAGDLERKSLFPRIARSVATNSVDYRIIGIGHMVDETALLSLAQTADATYVHAATSPASAQLPSEIAKRLREPVIRRVKMEVPLGVADVMPSRLPALHFGQSLVVTGRVVEPVHGQIHITGQLGDRPYSSLHRININPQIAETSLLAERLWVRQKLEDAASRLDAPGIEFGLSKLAQSMRVTSPHLAWQVLESEQRGLFPLLPIGSINRATVAQFDEQDFTFKSDDGRMLQRSFPNSVVQVGPILTANGSVEDAACLSDMLKSVFHACHTMALGLTGDWIEGDSTTSFRVGIGGAIEATGWDARRSKGWNFLAQCVNASTIGDKCSSSSRAPEEIRASAKFSIDWASPNHMYMRHSDGMRQPVQLQVEFTDGGVWATESNHTPKKQAHKGSFVQTQPERELQVRRLLRSGQFAQAIDMAQGIARDFPASPTAHAWLLQAAKSGTDPGLLAAAWEAHLSITPDDAVARVELARFYLSLGDEQSACAHYRSLRVTADDSAIATNLERCHRRWLGQHDASRAEQPRPPTDHHHGCQTFTVTVDCQDPQRRCPIAQVQTPSGDVVVAPQSYAQPTPSTQELGFFFDTEGEYRVVLLGGARGANGKAVVNVIGRKKTFEFQNSGIPQILATVKIRANRYGSPASMLYCN